MEYIAPSKLAVNCQWFNSWIQVAMVKFLFTQTVSVMEVPLVPKLEGSTCSPKVSHRHYWMIKRGCLQFIFDFTDMSWNGQASKSFLPVAHLNFLLLQKQYHIAKKDIRSMSTVWGSWLHSWWPEYDSGSGLPSLNLTWKHHLIQVDHHWLGLGKLTGWVSEVQHQISKFSFLLAGLNLWSRTAILRWARLRSWSQCHSHCHCGMATQDLPSNLYTFYSEIIFSFFSLFSTSNGWKY